MVLGKDRDGGIPDEELETHISDLAGVDAGHLPVEADQVVMAVGIADRAEPVLAGPDEQVVGAGNPVEEGIVASWLARRANLRGLRAPGFADGLAPLVRLWLLPQPDVALGELV